VRMRSVADCGGFSVRYCLVVSRWWDGVQMLEVVKLEGHSSVQHMVLSRDTFLLQVRAWVVVVVAG
jgi:homeobox-leucine zipper protein